MFVINQQWCNQWFDFVKGQGILPTEINNSEIKQKLIDEKNRDRLEKNEHYCIITLPVW